MSPASPENLPIPTFKKFGKPMEPKTDPTRTKTLRNRWVRQMRARWGAVSDAVPEMLESVQHMPAVQQGAAFMRLMRQAEEETILQSSQGPWITPFVRAAFARGVIRGNLELRKLARQKPVTERAQNAMRLVVNQNFDVPTISAENVDAIIAAGGRADAFALEVESTWQGLTGVTEQVNTQVAQVLTEALRSRQTIRETSAAIRDRIDAIGVTRSELIARTETVAANNIGAVSEYAAAEDIIGEPVLVQWIATLDSRVRPEHLARHGKVFTQDQYLQLVGAPNCRCSGTPYIESVEGTATKSKAKQFKDMTKDQAERLLRREAA
jgi:SPP1 gp7 family putative phage head morphogenesis protein